MECLARGNTPDIVRWNALHESPIFNSDADGARKNKERLRQQDKYYGRHSHYRRPGRKMTAQRAHFRITPLFAIEDLYEKPNADQKHATCAAHACAWHSAKIRIYVITNLLKESSHRQDRLSPFPDWSVVSDRPSTLTPSSSPALLSRLSDTSCLTISDSSTPLPVFQRRPPVNTDRLLFTRPTIFKALPLEIKDELFTIIANSIDLRPLPFKKTSDSYKFYEYHYPLLLTTVSGDKDQSQTTSKRSRTPESPMSVMIARKRWLNERLVDLGCQMVAMEKATEDVPFKTELHDVVFDPTTYPWNRLSTNQLRRRYTIDASLREMF